MFKRINGWQACTVLHSYLWCGAEKFHCRCMVGRRRFPWRRMLVDVSLIELPVGVNGDWEMSGIRELVNSSRRIARFASRCAPMATNITMRRG